MTPRPENKSSMPSQFLDCFGFGIILLDGEGRAMVVNAAAADLMGRASLYTDGAGALRSSHTQLDAAFRALPSEASESVVRVEPDGGESITVWVRAWEAESIAPGNGGSKSVFIMPGTPPALSVDTLAKMLCITPAEARVVQGLWAGKSLMECAREMGLAHNTVRNQLRSVHSKTGTSTQSELLLMIQRLAPPLRFA